MLTSACSYLCGSLSVFKLPVPANRMLQAGPSDNTSGGGGSQSLPQRSDPAPQLEGGPSSTPPDSASAVVDASGLGGPGLASSTFRLGLTTTPIRKPFVYQADEAFKRDLAAINDSAFGQAAPSGPTSRSFQYTPAAEFKRALITGDVAFDKRCHEAALSSARAKRIILSVPTPPPKRIRGTSECYLELEVAWRCKD